MWGKYWENNLSNSPCHTNSIDWAGESGAGLVSPLLGESDVEPDLADGRADDGRPYTSGAVSAVGGAIVMPFIVIPPGDVVLHPATLQLLVGTPMPPGEILFIVIPFADSPHVAGKPARA